MTLETVSHETASLQEEKPANNDEEVPTVQPDSTLHPTEKLSDENVNDDELAILYPGDQGFDENNAAVHFVVNEWAQSTSIHGVPFVTDGGQWKLWKRLVWIGLVLLSAAFMLWQISQLIRQYRSYEVITDTETITPVSLPFPEVTICNSNGFSKSRKALYNITDPQTEQEFNLISTPLEEFINATWFNGVPLNVSKVWKPKINSAVGRCWAFRTEERVRRPAYYAGLKVWADLQQADYEDATNFASAFVWVEQPGTLIDGSLTVNSAKPGKESYVKLQMSQFVRERQAPWARCQGTAPGYTQVRCRSECTYSYIREHCGCREYGDDNAGPLAGNQSSLRLCQKFHNPVDRDCVNEAYIRDEQVWGSCLCDLPSCSETQYEGFMIEADIANNWLENTFDSEAYNVTPDYFLENYVSVTVNYGKIQYELLTESKAVTFAQLLGSIGGSMGLFLGISLLSVFELVGDLGLMRLVPRWFGYRNLYGLGVKTK